MSDTSLTPALLIVLVAAKAIALAGHDVPLTAWSAIAFFWQDAAVVLVFAALERATAKRAKTAVACVYVVLALYVALNVPVTRVLSTPLTWSMLRAARGPLSDSILLYATWDNILLSLTIVALATILPLMAPRLGSYLPAFGAPAILIAVTVLGPIAAQRVDTRGLDRNAWTALITTAMPRAIASAAGEWDETGFEQAVDRQNAANALLSQFRGAAAGRHVIVVSLESTAAQYLGLYGAHPDVMPNLTELAQHAIVFDHAYAVYPESIKGLFSILCSSYPAFDRAAESYADVPCNAIPSALGARGYHTALFHSGRFGYLGMDAIIRNRGFDVLVDAGDIGGRHDSSFGVDEPSTVARMLAWIDALPTSDRFFLTYLPIAGHHPYDTPEPGPFAVHADIDRYRNALHYGDAALGALMNGIRARELEKQTLWIVYGDHGEAFGQHDGNYGHTFQIFEENVHVPLVVALPGEAPGLIDHPMRSRQVVSLIDIAPTLLDLIGEPVHGAYQGRSMLDGTPRMAFFFADYSLGLLGLRDGRFKAIDELESGRAKLFDLELDAEERRDLAGRDAARIAWYSRELRRWSAAQRRRVIN